jgi:hypothetical protein
MGISKWDSIRGAVAALAALIAISLAISPRLPGHQMGPQVIACVVFGLVVALCIWTSKSKAGVALGVLAIVVFRFLVAGFFIASGVYRRN